MCNSYSRNKKKASAALKPILSDLGNLGSMDPRKVRECLFEGVTQKQSKELKDEIGIAVRLFENIQV